MKLLEVVPGERTDPGVLAFIQDYAERALGKGVVLAKDTPNFIANRIGISRSCTCKGDGGRGLPG
jgi:3-hydroxyacyl-CoA dehydrogenase